MENIIIDGKNFSGYRIATPNGNIILITAPRGLLGCGYFKTETADKLNDALAVVSGVKNFDDMLSAKIIALSTAAEKSGITLGMSGREALLLLA
ncbi:MAG: DUF1805 domain-containing protein [Victivallaceae bacterium]